MVDFITVKLKQNERHELYREIKVLSFSLELRRYELI